MIHMVDYEYMTSNNFFKVTKIIKLIGVSVQKAFGKKRPAIINMPI